MELLTKTREELLEYAKKLNLELPKTISDDKLRNLIETEAIRKTVELEEMIRLKLQEQSRMKREIAEIQAEAEVRNIAIEIPKEPTPKDIIALKKQLNLMIKEPKPSPETIAIEKSKKVYVIFHNMEQEDMDVTFCPGGKYWFHLWPEKVHVLPEWLIGWLGKIATYPIYDKKMVPNPQAVKIGDVMERSAKVGSKRRFLFEEVRDKNGVVVYASDKARFGVVLDEKTLSKFKLPE
jgi:hypothetical protein